MLMDSPCQNGTCFSNHRTAYRSGVLGHVVEQLIQNRGGKRDGMGAVGVALAEWGPAGLAAGSFCPAFAVVVHAPFVIAAQGADDAAFYLVGCPTGGPRGDRFRFNDGRDRGKVAGVTPKAPHFAVVLRDFLLLLLCDVVLFKVYAIAHVPRYPVLGAAVPPVLSFRAFGDPDPCGGYFFMDGCTGGGGYAQKNVVVGNSPVLEFQSPKVREGMAEEAADYLEPAVEIMLDGLSVDGALIVVGQAELRLYDVTTIAADVAQAAAGLAGEFPNVGP